jgi:hypothetical protein
METETEMAQRKCSVMEMYTKMDVNDEYGYEYEVTDMTNKKPSSLQERVGEVNVYRAKKEGVENEEERERVGESKVDRERKRVERGIE